VGTPLVSIIVLNWNGESLIEECVRSLKNTQADNFEVVVVDNASNDHSLELLGRFEGIKLVKNSTNLGFAKGNNQGFGLARGKYVATVNNDAVVEPSWLNAPLALLEADDTIGIISCRQMNYFDREKIDVLFSYPSRFLLLQRMGHGEVFGNNPLHFRKGLVIGASGAAVVYRKKMLEEIDGFEESFFAYHEETDLFFRAFLAGWKCVYVPSSVVYHKGSASFGSMKKTFCYYHERNRIWFIYRNFPLGYIIVNFPSILFRETRTLVKAILMGNLGALWAARIDGFREMFRFSSIRAKNIAEFRKKKIEYLRFLREKVIPVA
jgi:GT2 family glycosyltransferase